MAYPTDRVILHDRAGNLLPELSPEQVFSRKRTEEVNGEHELVIVTTRRMEEGWRALTVDASGRWREWVLTEPDEAHESGKTAIGTYRFVWSLQYDLKTSYSHTEAEAGMGTSCTSLYALEKALEGVNGWEAGLCDASDIEAGKGCVMIYESAWSRLSKVVEVTGGEVDADITVSNLYGVTSRKVTLNAHVGSTKATRRFDWGYDVSNIHRIPDPGPYYCRVVPLGRGEQEYAEDDETTFEWPLDITEETGDPNLYYIQDDEAAETFKVPDGKGGWIYPTKAVTYSEDDPELLLNAAMDDLHNHTRPGVTYEADVIQFAEAGMDVNGVALGDDIHIVDKGFNPDAPLRLQGRVVRIEVDELSPETTTVLTIGSVRQGFTSIANTLSQLQQKQADISKKMAGLDTAKYLRGLLDRINAEIAATGGYAYLVPGQGLITYDAAVADPVVGSEASKVVQIKGGYLRIANSKKAGFSGIDDWDWKTVFESGHILSDLVTAVKITAGFIGNATNGNYWNLDTGEFRMATNAVSVGDESLGDYVGNIVDNATENMFTTDMLTQQAVFNALTNSGALQGLYMANNQLYINATYINTGHIGDVASGNYWNLDTGELRMASTLAKVGDKTIADYVDGKVDDATSGLLTQQTVFNALTNDGALQGLYMSNGNLYINGTYIKGGTIVAGGANNVNGTIEVYDAKGNKVADLSKDGANITGVLNLLYTIVAGDGWGNEWVSAIIGPFTVNFNSSYSATTSGTKYGMRIHRDYNKSSITNDIYLLAERQMGFLGCNKDLLIQARLSSSADYSPYISLASDGVRISSADTSTKYAYLAIDSTGVVSLVSRGGSNTQRLTISTTYVTVQGNLSVTGTKPRLVETKNYNDRLLYAYETPAPYFGDIGSATIGEDGLCYVEIDDIFSETARVDMVYQVFLQKCGQGDLWVEEKTPTHFVVKGTPNLAFDWELKAHQKDYESIRMEMKSLDEISGDVAADAYQSWTDAVYQDDLDYAAQIEALYETEETTDEAA